MTNTDSFMNTLYNAIGAEVTGAYRGVPFHGVIVDTRAKSGTDIQVTVEDGDEWYVMDASVLMVGESASYSNLRVYF
jgi:hypothetical protein